MSINLPPLPEPDINTASHIGQRIVGYTEKTVERLRLEAVEADRAERQGEAVPVAWVNGDDLDNMLSDRTAPIFGEKGTFAKVPLHTHPAPAQQPLSEEHIRQAINNSGMMFTHPDLRIARAIEAAHGIGGEK